MLYTVWKGKPGVPGNQVAQANSLGKAREARDAVLAKDPQAALSVSRFCRDEGDDESGHYEESYDLVLSEESVNKPDKGEPAPARRDWSPEVYRRESERGADGRLPKRMR